LHRYVSFNEDEATSHATPEMPVGYLAPGCVIPLVNFLLGLALHQHHLRLGIASFFLCDSRFLLKPERFSSFMPSSYFGMVVVRLLIEPSLLILTSVHVAA